MTRYWSYWKI